MNSLKKLLLIPLVFVFLAVAVQATSVTTSLFYDSTSSNFLTITNTDQFGVIISADSVLESSMTINLDLLDSSGNVVNNLFSIYTTDDSYSNFLIFGQSAYLGPGDYTLVSTVTTASGQSDTDFLILEVLPQIPTNNPPVINPIPNQAINEGTNYSYQVVATDADGDVLTYTLTQAPSWLSINPSTGLISGTAPFVNANTNFSIVISVSDSRGGVATQSYVLTVLNVLVMNQPPVANNQSVTTNENTPVMITLTGSDSDGTIVSFSIVSNPLYGVLSAFNSAIGQLTYTPNANYTGPDSFTFTVTDDDGAVSAPATVSITVNPVTGNNPPVITSTPVTQVNEGVNYVYDVEATDADNDPLIYSLTQAPSWLSINSSTGLISGTAPFVNANTNFSIVISVSDSRGGVATQSYVLTVRNTQAEGERANRGSRVGARTISGNEFEEQKYLDQFAPVAGVEPGVPTEERVNLFWLFLFLLLVLLIIVLAILIFRLRKER